MYRPVASHGLPQGAPLQLNSWTTGVTTSSISPGATVGGLPSAPTPSSSMQQVTAKPISSVVHP